MSSLRDSIAKFSVADEPDSDMPTNQPRSRNATPPVVISSLDVLDKADQMKSAKRKRHLEVDDDFDDEYEMLSQAISIDASQFSAFDEVADKLFEIDEDNSLRLGLIAQGRKYNQSHSQTGEASEIEKAFSKHETALTSLISDIDRDIASTEKDINNLRMARVRSPKALSDLIAVKGSLYSTKLSAIKESASMTTKILDLNMKAKKNSEDENESGVAASIALQQFISGNSRAELGESSYRQTAIGAPPEDTSLSAQQDLDEQEAEAAYLQDESEGDIYVKYEQLGVQLYAQVDEDDNVIGIVARDHDGNIINDYPLPETDDVYEVHKDLGTVTDTYHRSYIIERV